MASQWPPWDVTSSLRNLQLLREIVNDPRSFGVEAEPLGWLSRLLIVRSCGYLEQSVFECARGFVQAKSGGLIRSFSLTWLERTRNPKPDALEELAGRFDALLRDELQLFLDQDDARLRRNLYALVERRNRIAHGANEGATRESALEMATVSEEVANWWILALNPFK